MFSKTSDVAVVLTSCGRFDILRRTLDSFFEHNTYPIKQLILIEDSGKQEVHDSIPPPYRGQIDVIINNSRIGQIASIDKGYRVVETDYIFHCEDDWLFYRPGFIEDSKKVLEAEPCALFVQLRSFHHDLAFYGSRTARLGERKIVENVVYYKQHSTIPGNQCFSFNPALRRKADCIAGGYATLMKKNQSPGELEGVLSKKYWEQGFFSAILENDAVKHIGFDCHVPSYEIKWKKYRSRLGRLALIIMVFILGWWIGHSL